MSFNLGVLSRPIGCFAIRHTPHDTCCVGHQCKWSTDPPTLLTHAGLLPVADLRLDSYVYKQQPTLSRSSYSHVDNEGVKALVDGICNRWCAQNSGEWRLPSCTPPVCPVGIGSRFVGVRLFHGYLLPRIADAAAAAATAQPLSRRCVVCMSNTRTRRRLAP